MDKIVITLDTDWAPDFVIDFVADRIAKRKVRATWFVTHSSPAVDRLKKQQDLFEIGIHPNFLAGSTHGDTLEVVLKHCLSMVPEATSTRSHGLFQSSALLEHLVRKTAITVDVSLFLPHAKELYPVRYTVGKRVLVRLPYFWEDDYEMLQEKPVWNAASLLSSPGLKVFNFHPIHIYLNSSDPVTYEEVKLRVGGDVSRAEHQDMSDLVRSGEGPRSTFDHLLEHLSEGGRQVREFADFNTAPDGISEQAVEA